MSDETRPDGPAGIRKALARLETLGDWYCPACRAWYVDLDCGAGPKGEGLTGVLCPEGHPVKNRP